RAEVMDVMVRADDAGDVGRCDAELGERCRERRAAVARVHAGVDQSPRGTGAHEPHVDDGRLHGEREEDLHHPVGDLADLRRRLAHFGYSCMRSWTANVTFTRTRQAVT